jgi:hypothetical protein
MVARVPHSHANGGREFVIRGLFAASNNYSTRYRELNGGNFDLWGKNFHFLEAMSKNLLFFSEMVGRVATEFTL